VFWPTVTYREGGKVKIYVTSNIDANNVVITEYVPVDWSITTDGKVNVKNNLKTIEWKVGKVKKGDRIVVSYSFDPPDITPYLSLIGPLEITYNGNNLFKEAREWSVSIDAAFLYYARWTWYWRDTQVPLDQLVLCRGDYYNVSILMTDEADDTATGTAYLSLQIMPPGTASYTSLPAYGWTLWGGQTNSINITGELGTNNACNNGDASADQCAWRNATINITTDAPLGTYKVKLVSSVNNGAWQDGTNIITVNVIDCRDVNLARRIRIYSPSGEDGVVIRGHMARIVVPITNYNPSVPISGNVSVNILDNNGNSVNWFFWDSKVQNFTLPASSNPFTNVKTLTWRFEVPDDAQDITYTLVVNISQNTSSFYSYTKSFGLKKSLGEGNPYPLVIYTATSYSYPCDGGTTSGYGFFVSVCNFGDYNLTVNISSEISPKPNSNPYYLSGVQGTYDTSANTIYWRSILINTSSCFFSEYRLYGPEDVGLPGSITTTVFYINPETGSQETVSQTDYNGVCEGATTTVWGGSPTPLLNITQFYPNSTFGLNYQLRVASGTQGAIHYVEIYIPPGLNVSSSSFSRVPDPGFPLGSIDEGFIVRWTFIGNQLLTPTTQGAFLSFTNITINSADLTNFYPGSKVFYQNLLGYGNNGGAGNLKCQWYGNYKVPLVMNGP